MSEVSKMVEPTKVHLKVKRPRRFKAGAELSGAVNLVGVEITEEVDAEMSRFELVISLEKTYTEQASCEE